MAMLFPRSQNTELEDVQVGVRDERSGLPCLRYTPSYQGICSSGDTHHGQRDDRIAHDSIV